ncbi:VirB8/TrbF family protein [Pseudomonas sp. JG-B]|uniref:VirB8/TrbF family protein n=1 Tax=Pseudomonas sp. JG-B TaxID=2603214 RepID=UPI001C4988DD|nr:VirB8/TrbF family protein [Pseudomonas sp. JG-B]
MCESTTSTGIVDTISRIKDGKTTYEERETRYFLKRYVRYREEFNKNVKTENYTAVGLMSTKEEAKRYLDYYSPKLNPKAPINIYGDTGDARVKFKSLSFINDDVALVRFIVYSKIGANDPVPEHRAATITFSFGGEPLKESEAEINPLGFKVSDYRSDTESVSGQTQQITAYSMKRLALVAALILPALCMAEVTPIKGQYDPRVRVVDYNPLNVVKLVTYYGVSTHVQFNTDEEITEVALGDGAAWDIQPRGRNLFIKPLLEQADTNVTVVTNKRIYQFSLNVRKANADDPEAWKNADLIFSLSFRYPDEELLTKVKNLESEQKAEKDKKQKQDIEKRLATAKKGTANLDYWVAGSEEVIPTAVRDDGRFTYLTFSNNRQMPAIYTVDDFGQRSAYKSNCGRQHSDSCVCSSKASA